MVSSPEQSSGCGSFACVSKCTPLMPAIPLLEELIPAHHRLNAEEDTWHHSGWVWTWRYVWLCPGELLWVQREKSCLLATRSSAPSAVWSLLMSAAGLARASLESPSAVLNVSSLHNSLDPMCLCIAEAACSPSATGGSSGNSFLFDLLCTLKAWHCRRLSLELLCPTDRRSCGPAGLPLPALVMARFLSCFLLGFWFAVCDELVEILSTSSLKRRIKDYLGDKSLL